jgi:hypothetical protein
MLVAVMLASSRDSFPGEREEDDIPSDIRLRCRLHDLNAGQASDHQLVRGSGGAWRDELGREGLPVDRSAPA